MGFFLFAAAVSSLGSAAHAQYIPSVSPVPSLPGSHAFDSAFFARVPQNLTSVGYDEKEYFLSGQANAYQYNNPTNPADDSVSPVQASPVSYVNRILVRAPTNPARFSGNVILELADDTNGEETSIEWAHANRQFILNGDAYILLSSTPASVAALQTFNATRYGALNWPVVPATETACNAGPEEGIIYDEITGLGTLLKSNGSGGPLPGYDIKRVFITGYSGAAVTLLAYNRVFGLNSPLFNGYFVDAGGPRNQINGCESLAAAAIRTQPPASTVSPVYQRQTESEIVFFSMITGRPPKGTDSNTPTNRYRYYEVAGASHVDGDTVRGSPELSDVATLPPPASLTEDQALTLCGQSAPVIASAFPNRYIEDAFWANLERWAAAGTSYSPPTEASPLLVDMATFTGAEPPQGGVRSPAVDVPIDTYIEGALISATASAADQSFCALTGGQEPNGQALDPAAEIADAAKLVAQGFIMPYDLTEIVTNPTHGYTFPDGSVTIPNGN